MANELVVMEPREAMARGDAIAMACRAAILKNSIQLRGKKYITIEGWQTLARGGDLSPRIDEVEELENGDMRAVCSLIRLSDGAMISRAEGYVGVDEPTWASRPRHARRAMAQTRAISRACRSGLGWVVPLMDGSLSTTPAEEMDHILPAPTTYTPTAAPATRPPPSVTDPATPIQLLRIRALLVDLPTVMVHEVRTRWGTSSSLSALAADEVIAHLQAAIDAEPVDPPTDEDEESE